MKRAWPFLVFAIFALPVVYRLSWREAGGAPSGKTEITYMAWGYPSQLDTERDLIAAFERENPDVDVTFIMAPMQSYYDKIQIMFVSGTAPDVMRVNPEHFAAYSKLGHLRRLDGFMDADPGYNPGDYFPAARDAGLVGDGHWALGVLFTRTLVYYNKTLFRKAGVEEPWDAYLDGRWMWDDYLETAKKLTVFDEKTGRALQFGTNFPGRIYNFFALVWDKGGDILTPDMKHCLLNSREAVDALEWTRDLRTKWRVAPTPEQGALSIFAFESGGVAMEIDSSGESPRLRDAITTFDWDVAPTPAARGRVSGGYGAHLLVMNAKTNEAQAAWRFMKFVTGPTAETLLGVKLRRCIPTRRDIALSQEYLSSDKPPFNMGAFVADIDLPQRRTPYSEKWTEWTTELQSHLDEVWLGAKEPRQAADEAVERIDIILNSP